MAWLFSKRCKQALNAKKIRVSIPLAGRVRIFKALRHHNDSYRLTTETGYNYDSSTLEELTDNLKAELGIKDFMAFPEDGGDSPKPGDLEAFVLRGNYPPYLLDTIELFYDKVAAENKRGFQKSINEIMEESGLPWRMAEGKIFPVDSAYVEEAILRTASALLHEVGFQGALQEFAKARTDLVNRDCSGAIQNANLAVESTIKGILGIERAKPGELFRKLIDSQIVPEYYSGFLKSFEDNILRSVAIIRNDEPGAGHGQGTKVNEISPALAELTVHLAGVLIHFLIRRHLEKSPPPSSGEESVEECPF